MRWSEQDEMIHIVESIEIGEFEMDIAQRLSWEIVAMNDRGFHIHKEREKLALEIAYGVALQVGDQPELFSAFLSSIIGQVTDGVTQRYLRIYAARGLK